MKMKKIFTFLVLILLISCNNTDNQENKDWVKISENLQYRENKELFFLKSGKKEYRLQKKRIPFQKIMVFNTTLLGFITELGQENKIVGIAGTQYVFSERIKTLIFSGKIQEVGNEQKYDVEKIISLKPDVIFTNYIVSFENTYETLRKNGIEIIFLDDYMEQNPLEKAAYLKLFGKLLGEEQKSEDIYAEIELNYHNLIKKVKKSERKYKVIVGEMYGNHWFMAGGQSYVAHYLKDANAEYLFGNNQEKGAIPISFEEVFVKSRKAEYWMNLGNYHSKQELLALNSAYQKLPVFRNGKIYSIAKRQKGDANDIFEQGSVRVDWVLKDYIKIFHPEVLPEDTLLYMKELN